MQGNGSNPNALKILQEYSLAGKIAHSQRKIKEWHEHYKGLVYVSFSGGKDSTILLHLVREMYPEVPAVFADTGLEFPEIRKFVKENENVVWVKPKMPFTEVIDKYGYPIISKEQACYIDQYRNTNSQKLRDVRFNGKPEYRCKSVGKISEKWKYLIEAPFKISDRCCYVMKKSPLKSYETKTGRKPIIGTMAGESSIRTLNYHRTGCNAFSLKRPTSTPITFWNEGDVWAYIKLNTIKYSSIYDMGYSRTGCMFCLFGYHAEDAIDNRLTRMAITHPKMYSYCMNKLKLKEVLAWYPTQELPNLGEGLFKSEAKDD